MPVCLPAAGRRVAPINGSRRAPHNLGIPGRVSAVHLSPGWLPRVLLGLPSAAPVAARPDGLTVRRGDGAVFGADEPLTEERASDAGRASRS